MNRLKSYEVNYYLTVELGGKELTSEVSYIVNEVDEGSGCFGHADIVYQMDEESIRVEEPYIGWFDELAEAAIKDFDNRANYIVKKHGTAAVDDGADFDPFDYE